MCLDLSRHPCFNEGSCSGFGRVHLPVAPKCNVQCRFCNRKYNCLNESRPGVTSGLLTPGQAVEYLAQVIRLEPSISVAGIAGPGDPFANAAATLDTLRRIRQGWNDMLLCVSSNGLNVAAYADQLAEIRVTHMTVTVCATEVEIANRIYSWVRLGKKVYRGNRVGEIIVERQAEAIEAIKAHDILLKINCIVIPGVNDHHVLQVAEKTKRMGADLFNVMPLCVAAGSEFENFLTPSDEFIHQLRNEAEKILPQMKHCRRCRADAVGKLGDDRSLELAPVLKEIASGPAEPCDNRPYVAVASREGFLVNEHLGQSEKFMIFGRLGDEAFKFVEYRRIPQPGGGNKRWLELADILQDCRGVLVSGVGVKPREILKSRGVKVYEMEGLIEEGLTAIYRGTTDGLQCRSVSCSECSGDGTGCG